MPEQDTYRSGNALVDSLLDAKDETIASKNKTIAALQANLDDLRAERIGFLASVRPVWSAGTALKPWLLPVGSHSVINEHTFLVEVTVANLSLSSWEVVGVVDPHQLWQHESFGAVRVTLQTGPVEVGLNDLTTFHLATTVQGGLPQRFLGNRSVGLTPGGIGFEVRRLGSDDRDQIPLRCEHPQVSVRGFSAGP